MQVDNLRRDVVYAVRLLWRRPALAATALTTLAVGIGLNTAVFSLANGVLWRSLPLANSDRLVRLFQTDPTLTPRTTLVSPANFLDWRTSMRSLDALAAFRSSTDTLVDGGDPEQINTLAVTADFFRVAPARPVLGRLFTAFDFEAMTRQIETRAKRFMTPVPQTVILSEQFWRRRYGGRDVVGQHVRLDRDTLEIVGVADADFVYPYTSHVDAWVPYAPDPIQRRARYLISIGRLAPGVTLEAAQADFDAIGARLAAAYPADNKNYGVQLTPLLEDVSAPVRRQIRFLMGAAACVLLIVCANVANLILAQAAGRRQELALRAALGASRAQLLRQALTEALVLAIAGGALGLACAFWTVRALVALAPATIPRLQEVGLDPRVLAFATMAALVVGVLCGLGVGLSIGRPNPAGMLRAAGLAARAHGRMLRQVLAISEVATALVLVIATGLLVRTMRNVEALPLGFDPANVISIGLTPDVFKYRAPGAKSRYESDLIERVRALPGVAAVGIGQKPLGGAGMGTTVTLPSNAPRTISLPVDAVGPGYLEALGARVTEGRFFTTRDDSSAPMVAAVNSTAAATFWPRGNAVGQIVVHDETPLQIVGVVADVRRAELERDPGPTLYLPAAQTGRFWTNNILVRTTGEPRAILPAVRTIMRQVDRDQALTRVETLEERLADATASRRYTVWLVGFFSAIAFALAVLGVYAVVSESVAQRIAEIGIRVALGASRGDVIGLVVRHGLLTIGPGLLVGGAAAVAFNKVMTGFVFRVATTDPLSFAAACGCLLIATLAACAIPARRAARMDPVVALRAQ